jgi:hypothetical protein
MDLKGRAVSHSTGYVVMVPLDHSTGLTFLDSEKNASSTEALPAAILSLAPRSHTVSSISGMDFLVSQIIVHLARRPAFMDTP